MNGYSEHKPVRHHPQAAQRGVIQVRTLQPADQLQRVHAGDRQHVGVGVAPGRHREHRVRDGPERPGDDRLVELARARSRPPPSVSTAAAGWRRRLDRLVARRRAPACALTASAWLQRRASRSFVIRRAHAGRSSVIRRSLPARSALLRVSQIQGGDTHGDTQVSQGCPPLPPVLVTSCAHSVTAALGRGQSRPHQANSPRKGLPTERKW